MSGIYITGMEMPTSCFQCEFRTKIDPENLMCIISQKTFEDRFYHIEHRDNSCPLIPVPPHGRLGDLDKLENGLRHMARYQHGERQQGILGCCETIRLAPTIIPADKEGEERLVQKTQQPPSNADRIRVMADVGLAAWYCHDRDCRGCEFGATDGCHILDWLKAPVEVQE